MNERQHIALTEAQIIAAEKGDLQLETRDGRKVVQFVWLRPPFDQNRDCLCVICETGCNFMLKKTGMWASSISPQDLFVSKPAIKQEQILPKPLYEVGEIIEVIEDDEKCDAEYITTSRGKVIVWESGCVESYSSGNHRKKQTEKTVTLENKVMTVKEAFKFLTNL